MKKKTISIYLTEKESELITNKANSLGLKPSSWLKMISFRELNQKEDSE